MDLQKQDRVRRLLEANDHLCMTLYMSAADMPADTSKGSEADPVLVDIRSQLESLGFLSQEIETMIDPVEDMLSEPKIKLRDNENCVAFFVSQEVQTFLTYKGECQQIQYIGEEFYLLPLMHLFNTDRIYYLLDLQEESASFFRCSPLMMKTLWKDRKMPDNVMEHASSAAGNDDKDPRGNPAGTSKYENGELSDEATGWTPQSFNEMVGTYMSRRKPPLVLAGPPGKTGPLADLIGDKRSNIYELHTNSTQDADEKRLHRDSCRMLKDYFAEKLEMRKHTFLDAIGKGKVSLDINFVLPAAAEGKVEVLFLSKEADRYGHYDAVNNTLIISNSKKVGESSLHNRAALETWRHGGQVYLLDHSEMPVPGSSLNALLC